MAVEDPGQLTVTCDECGKTEDMDTTEFAGDPPSWGVDDSTLEQNGWVEAEGKTLCPECKPDEDEDAEE